MKYITALFLLALLSGCAQQKVIGLRGNYSRSPYELTTTSKFNDVWNRLIDLFAKKGIGVKLLDRSSGFIVAQNIQAPVTHEKKDGTVANASAFIITSKYYDPGSRKYYYINLANIEWNIHLVGFDGGTKINVNLINVDKIGFDNAILVKNPQDIKSYSTGVFEKIVTEYIK
jgi:hypothetical protein